MYKLKNRIIKWNYNNKLIIASGKGYKYNITTVLNGCYIKFEYFYEKIK